VELDQRLLYRGSVAGDDYPFIGERDGGKGLQIIAIAIIYVIPTGAVLF